MIAEIPQYVYTKLITSNITFYDNIIIIMVYNNVNK